jgi:hypothetical protein
VGFDAVLLGVYGGFKCMGGWVDGVLLGVYGGGLKWVG